MESWRLLIKSPFRELLNIHSELLVSFKFDSSNRSYIHYLIFSFTILWLRAIATATNRWRRIDDSSCIILDCRLSGSPMKIRCWKICWKSKLLLFLVSFFVLWMWWCSCYVFWCVFSSYWIVVRNFALCSRVYLNLRRWNCWSSDGFDVMDV